MDRSVFSGLHVVVIGGGTGTPVLLRELKRYTKNITAVVTVADDGGSSGLLKRDLHMLPPGDIRNCIIALADEESRLRQLMDYRFAKGKLRMHSFGNIFIAAMAQTSESFAQAISEVSEVLRVTGRVLPVTTNIINLSATLKNGKTVKGESYIPRYAKRQKSAIDFIEIIPAHTQCYTPCIKAIMEADIIVYAPGSLYTSIIPNILVGGIVPALKATKAKRYFAVNILNQSGETDGYSVADHYQAFKRHAHGENIVDCVIYNTSSVHNEEIIKKYRILNGYTPIPIPDEQTIEKMHCETMALELIKIVQCHIRHNAEVLWDAVFENYINTQKKKKTE